MATRDGRRHGADVFLVQRTRVVDDETECVVVLVDQLSAGIELAEHWCSMFEDCLPGVEVWLGDQCVFLAGTSEDNPPFMKGGNTGPVAPGRYRWEAVGDDGRWRLVGPA